MIGSGVRECRLCGKSSQFPAYKNIPAYKDICISCKNEANHFSTKVHSCGHGSGASKGDNCLPCMQEKCAKDHG